MNNKLKLAIILIIFILILVSAWIFSNKTITNISNKNSNNIYTKPTKSIIIPNSQSTYRIISVLPMDEEKNVPLDTIIEITFNLPPDLQDIEFSINPRIDSSSQISGQTLKIIPLNDLSPGTKYTYVVKYKNRTLPSRTYSFLTQGTFSNLPDTQPEGAAEAEAKFQRENHPDVYLSNQIPYESFFFVLTSEFTVDHFRFTVVQKSASAKQDFLNWLISLELTESQIDRLDITYR